MALGYWHCLWSSTFPPIIRWWQRTTPSIVILMIMMPARRLCVVLMILLASCRPFPLHPDGPLWTTDAIIVNGHGHEWMESESSSAVAAAGVECGAMLLHIFIRHLIDWIKRGLLNLEKLSNQHQMSFIVPVLSCPSLLKSVCLIRWITWAKWINAPAYTPTTRGPCFVRCWTLDNTHNSIWLMDHLLCCCRSGQLTRN